ncbi:hypothetical protein [Homoserinimonas hongtaonis]|uniref:hypothetical protein n=1 Tax=Homoserinimonas hongtaonis TaxID=2079791 RepID=UPI000D3D2B06|nr:hypothetical protein [Salinibacterium hongtaonis]AWB89686.1 hypothetical protein C2138_09150 [Salinibacterium hongtaonis]
MLVLIALATSIALSNLASSTPPEPPPAPEHQDWQTTLDDGAVRITGQKELIPALPGDDQRASLPSVRIAPVSTPVDLGPRDLCSARVWVDGRCWDLTEPRDPAAPVTIEDFISFAPAPARAASEPGAFAVRNLHTNFVAEAGVHIRSGELLGQPASAEFRPVAYQWLYGDGTSRMTTSAGASWHQLGLREFDPTATSHVYSQKGTVTVTLVTHYAVRASYADGIWWSVPGTLAIASPPLSLEVLSINTVLVDRDCGESPSGPGC